MLISQRILSDWATVTNYTEGDPSGEFNNPQPVATAQPPVPALFQQQATTEKLDSRDLITTRGVLLLPPGASISATSTVVLTSMPDVTWRVDGSPNQLPTHIEAVIERITG